MSNNPNEITPDNCAVVIIDHQSWVAFAVQSIDRSLLVNNVTGLCVAAKALGVPTVLTTVGAANGPLNDPFFHQITEVFPDQEVIDRVGTNAWAEIKPAVEATGRKILVMAGIWTEVCLAETTLSAMKDGYRVYFVSDCSGGVSVEAHEDGKTRMVQAGATPVTWIGLLAEWTPDYTSDERNAVVPALMEHGSGVGLSLEYYMANMNN